MVGAGLPWTGPASRRPSGTVSASLPLSLCLLLQVVLNQKFTDCFVLVFLDSHLGKTVRTGVRAVPHVLHPRACWAGGACFLGPACPPLTITPSPGAPVFPTVSDGSFPRALPSTAAGQREPPRPAGLHLPPPGVGHQHSLLHPLDPPPLRDGPPSVLCNCPAEAGLTCPSGHQGKTRP